MLMMVPEDIEKLGVQISLGDGKIFRKLAIASASDIQLGDAHFHAEGDKSLQGQLHIGRIGA